MKKQKGKHKKGESKETRLGFAGFNLQSTIENPKFQPEERK